MSQHPLGHFREQVFLEHPETTLLPSDPHQRGQWRDRLVNESLQAFACETLLQALKERVFVVPRDTAKQLAETAIALLSSVRLRSRCGQRPQFLVRSREKSPWAMALVHQAFDQLQTLDLFGRIQAFAVRSARRDGKAVAALPYAQHVFRQADIAFDGGDWNGRSTQCWLW